jgi:hypothetical protein
MKFFVLVFVVVLASMMPLLGFANASAQTPPRPDSPVPSVVPAPFTDHWRLNFSPYSLHYSHNPEHRPVWMLGLEKQRSDSYVWGATYFSNSFGQDSGYLYGGQRFENFTKYDAFFAQWTAGILYGSMPTKFPSITADFLPAWYSAWAGNLPPLTAPS